MKKTGIIFGIFFSIYFGAIGQAKEAFKDNQLDIKAERLKLDQQKEIRASEYLTKENLFEITTMNKLKKKKESDAKALKQEKSAYFLAKAAVIEPFDKELLFAENESKKLRAVSNEKESVSLSASQVIFLLSGAVIIPGALFLLYQHDSRKSWRQ